MRRSVAAAEPVEQKKRGVRWPSNATGEPSANVKHHRYTVKLSPRRSPTRAEKAAAISRRLAKRKVRPNAKSTRKSLLKRGKTIRQVRSLNGTKKRTQTRRAHSK
jgi:hypothetical protein